MGLASRDVVLPVVPMFHANAWGLALLRADGRRQLVMPGAKLDGASVHELLETTRSPSRPPCRRSGRCCCSTWKTTGGTLPI